MKKIKILHDPAAKNWGSTQIICNYINNALKRLDLYDDQGLSVMYDTLNSDYGMNPDAFMCAYELPMPQILLQRAGGKPFLGLSLDNGLNAYFGGYPPNLINFAAMGVDSKEWAYSYKDRDKTKPFTFLCACESNTRSGFEDLIPAFGETFANDHSTQLYIKDREVTPEFSNWVEIQAKKYNVLIIHDKRHIEGWEEQKKLFGLADAFICVNHGHSGGLNRLQAMSCGIPILTMRSQGGAEYLRHPTAGFEIQYSLENVTNELFSNLMSIGLRNYLIPITPEQYPYGAFWAKANFTDLCNKMHEMRNVNDGYRQILSVASRRVAEIFSWERTAANLSLVMTEYYANK